MGSNQLSRGGAIAMGLLFMACGLPSILFLFGVIRPSGDSQTPTWLGVCVGLLFVGGGAAIILDHVVARGLGPNGDFVPGTPFFVRVANDLLGLGIVGGMIAVFGWVAFGPGTRHFSSSIALPFLAYGHAGGQTGGRIAFGAGTILLVLMFIACGMAGGRRVWRMRPRRRP